MEVMRREDILREVASLEESTFPDAWSLESLAKTMGYSHHLLFTAWQAGENRVILLTRGDETSGEGEKVRLEDASESAVRILAEDAEIMDDYPEARVTFLGYLLASLMGDESELLRIAVADSARRTGVGKGLLARYFEELSEVESFFLEVREGNHPARGLYEEMGYRRIATRENYYKNPNENAVLYYNIHG